MAASDFSSGRVVAERAAADESAPQPPLCGAASCGPLKPDQVRWLIRAHRLRTDYLGEELIGDPGWELLLELLLARAERRALQASSLGICAGIPPATAHRWLCRLVEGGAAVRKADAHDGRRVLIELSDSAARRLDSYFREIYSAS